MRITSLIALLLFPLAAFSQNYVTRLQRMLKTATTDTSRVRIYAELSRYYQYSQPESATFYIRKGLKLSRHIHYVQGEGMMLNELGSVNEIHDNLDIAQKYLEEALAIFQKVNYKEGMAHVYNVLGVIAGKQDNLEAAAAYFQQAWRLYKEANDIQGMVQTCIKLGILNELDNNLDLALAYYRKAQEMSKTLPLSDTYINLLNKIGVVHAKKGDLRKALDLFEEGIYQSDTHHHARIHVSLLTNMGEAYEKLGDKETAVSHYKQALKKTKEYNLPEEEARTLMNIADMLKDENNTKSLDYLHNALDIAKQLGHKQLSADIYQAIAEIYKQDKRFEDALFALEEHHRMLDSLFHINKKQEFASLQANYELEESKVNIQRLQLINQKRTFERNIGIVITTAILLLLGILWFYFRKVRSLNRQLHESNQTKDKLFSIIGHDLRGPVGGIAQAMTMLETESFTPAEQKEIVSELKKQSEASLEVLNSLLNWGNIQLQGVKVNPVNFKPLPIITKNLSMLSNQASNKSINISHNIDENLVAHADPDHFDFIIRNLISNAIKFSYPNSTIAVNAITDPEKKTITFSVQDHGTGISEEKQQQFVKSNINTSFGTSGEKGTGLGLLLTKEFIQSNGGNIWLTSKEGEGTTFYFSLKTAN